MQHRRMAYRHLVADARRVRVPHHVNHGAVLDIGPIADADHVHVAADDHVHPDAALFANFHVADDLCALIDVGGRMNLRTDGAELTQHAGKLYRERLWALDFTLWARRGSRPK